MRAQNLSGTMNNSARAAIAAGFFCVFVLAPTGRASADSRWPMSTNVNGYAFTWYEPQATSWVDHKHLNHDVDFLKGIIPTAENIARAFWKILQPHIVEGKLYSIRLYESENNFVEYRGE